MPLYMYQAAYTPESWGAQLKNPQNRIETVGRQACEAVGGNSLVVGIASASTMRSSSAMYRTTKVCRQSRWLLLQAAPSKRRKQPS